MIKCLLSENYIDKIQRVSRVTVRDTLNRLAQAGYIYRIQGKGTFVSVRKIEKLTKLYTLRKRFEEKGVVHEVLR